MARSPPARLLGWGSVCPSRVRSPRSCAWSPCSAATWWVNHPGAIRLPRGRGLSPGCGPRGARRVIGGWGRPPGHDGGAGTPVPAAAVPPAPTGGRLKEGGGLSAAANGMCRRPAAPPHPGSASAGPAPRRENMEPPVRGWGGNDVRALGPPPDPRPPPAFPSRCPLPVPPSGVPSALPGTPDPAAPLTLRLGNSSGTAPVPF